MKIAKSILKAGIILVVFVSILPFLALFAAWLGIAIGRLWGKS